MKTPVTIDLMGLDARCNLGHTVLEVRGGKSDPVPPLARALIEGGVDADTLITIVRGGVVCFEPMRLGWWAGRQITDSATEGLRVRPYQPHPLYRSLHEPQVAPCDPLPRVKEKSCSERMYRK